jgi:hypothetical protein
MSDNVTTQMKVGYNEAEKRKAKKRERSKEAEAQMEAVLIKMS